MACCVLLAGMFGLVAAVRAILLLKGRGKQAAQAWRLREQYAHD